MKFADQPKIYGPALRAIRVSLDHSLAEVATMAGIDPTFLGRIEKGQRGCRPAVTRRLAEVLHVPLDAICYPLQPVDAA
jgi:transcriptional regulator with XRE-family HTH domain